MAHFGGGTDFRPSLHLAGDEALPFMDLKAGTEKEVTVKLVVDETVNSQFTQDNRVVFKVAELDGKTMENKPPDIGGIPLTLTESAVKSVIKKKRGKK